MKSIKLAFSRRQWMLSIAVFLIILLILLWSKLNFAGKNRIINEVRVEINTSDTSFQFLTQQEISNFVEDKIGNPIGKPASEVSLTELEIELNRIPYIQRAIVYVSFDGKLKVQINERQAIAQIHSHSETFYFDTSGVIMKRTKIKGPNVMVINGSVPFKMTPGKKMGHKKALELLEIAKFIHAQPLWNMQFEQCYVDKLERYLLFPRVGSHSIVLNNVVNLDKKFENLRLFYEKGLPLVGWNKYSEIEISYENQIVGRTND